MLSILLLYCYLFTWSHVSYLGYKMFSILLAHCYLITKSHVSYLGYKVFSLFLRYCYLFAYVIATFLLEVTSHISNASPNFVLYYVLVPNDLNFRRVIDLEH